MTSLLATTIRHPRLFIGALVAAAIMAMLIPASTAMAATITIDNGIPAGDPDHLRIDVRDGSRVTTLVVGTTDVVFAMFAVLDLGPDGVHQLGSFGVGSAPVALDANTVETTATIVVASGTVDVTVTTSIEPGSSFVLTNYAVTADFDLTGSRLFEYVDLDVLGFASDTFSFTGSIAGNDLILSQENGGLTVERSDPGQTATGFAIDFHPALRSAILGSGFDPPETGDVAATFGDITSALEYELSGSSGGGTTAIGRDVPTSLIKTKAQILKKSGVPGKGIDRAPGLQKAFNPNSKAAKNAGKRDSVEVCHVRGNGSGVLKQVTDKALAGHIAHGDTVGVPGGEIDEVESNDSIATAQPVSIVADACGRVANPLVISGTGDGSFDYYSFEVAAAGDVFVFEITSGNFDTELVLYDTAGAVLAADDDGGAGLLSKITHAFAAPGTYVIAVGEFNTSPTAGGMTGNVPDTGDVYVLEILLP